ncbi:MAG: hypothetical protein ACK4G5_11890, partial [Devosia sp.]
MRSQASFGRSDTGRKDVGTQKRQGIHPALFYSMFAVLLAGNALLGTAFLLSPDIKKLLSGQN